MKKLLVGCGLLTLILFVSSLIGGYLFIYRPLVGLKNEVENMQAWRDRVTNQREFTPPATGEPDARRLEAFVAIQRRNVERLGDRIDRGREVAAEWDDATRSSDGFSPQLVWSTVKLLPSFYRGYVNTRDDFVDDLNESGFSVAEYAWIRARFTDHLQSLLSASQLGDLRGMQLPGGIELPQGAGLPAGGSTPPAGGKPAADGTPDAQAAPATPQVQPPPAWLLPYTDEIAKWAVLWALDF